MNKTEFNNLDVLEQIEYINKNLLEGNTLTNVCKNIGIGRSTIRDRFKKVSYEYNKNINQYESIVEIIEAETVAPAGANEPIKENIKPVIQQSSNKVVRTEKFKVDDFEGDIVVRSYKLYEPIQREFLEFCKKNNKYKVQDILSQFIKEGLEKYR